MVGKSFPLRTASVHKRARSFTFFCDIVKTNTQASRGHLIQINAKARDALSSLTMDAETVSGRARQIMDWDDYFRQQAAMYRQLVQKTEDTFIKQELLDLAAVCEEVANNIEDHRTSG